MVDHEAVFGAFSSAVQDEVNAAKQQEEVFGVIKEGGDRGCATFLNMALQVRGSEGRDGLAEWVDFGFGLLPEADMKRVMVKAMECLLEVWDKQRQK